jgi:hypothetical protein
MGHTWGVNSAGIVEAKLACKGVRVAGADEQIPNWVAAPDVAPVDVGAVADAGVVTGAVAAYRCRWLSAAEA